MALNSEKKRLLSNVKNTIKKKWGEEAFISVERLDIPTISTGSVKIDNAIGPGGFPEGRIIEIYGPESCGKTTLTTLSMIEAQKKYPDHMCALVDVEHAYNLDYATKMGLDIDEERFLISQPSSGEEALDTMLKLIESGLFKVVALDSVGGLMTKEQIEKGIGEATMAQVARVLSQSMGKIAQAAKRSGTVVIFINQIRATMNMYGPSETTMGGNALPYWCSVRIKMRKIDVITDKDTPIGQTIRTQIIKNKVGTPFGVVDVNLIFFKGFDRQSELVETAIDAGIIERGGAWYYIDKGTDAEQKFQGKAGVIEYYKNNEDEYDKLLGLLFKSEENAGLEFDQNVDTEGYEP